MAEGDIILLQAIKKLFPENEENFTKLGDFTTDFVLEVTAKLLNVIHGPDQPFKNVKPPSKQGLRNKTVQAGNLDGKFQKLNKFFCTFMYSVLKGQLIQGLLNLDGRK